MASLFDDSSDSEMNRELESNDDDEDDDDDATTFTIATILQKRSGDKSRRDTITRTMPTISIHDSSDKFDNCKELLKTESLVMDDSSRFRSGRESNISDITSMESDAGGLFSTPSRYEFVNMPTIVRRNTANCTNDKVINEPSATIMTECTISKRRSSIEKFMSVYEDLEAQQITYTSTRTNDQSTSHATTNATAMSVKSFVATTLKNVAEGFVARATSNTIADTCDGIGSWDVDKDISNYSSKRSSLDMNTTIDYSNKDTIPRNRRKSLNIRAEMTLLQDMVQSKTDECSRLKRKLEEFQSHSRGNSSNESSSLQSDNNKLVDELVSLVNNNEKEIQSLKGEKARALELKEKAESLANELVSLVNANEKEIQSLKVEKDQVVVKANSLEDDINKLQEKADNLAVASDASGSGIMVVMQEKAILESKLLESSEAASIYNEHVKSLFSSLNESQSVADKLRLDLHEEREKHEAVVARFARKEKELAEKERESTSVRCEMQSKIVEMREALQQIKDSERRRNDRTMHIESELQETRNALLVANSKVAESEAVVASLHYVIDVLKKENDSLCALTPKRQRVGWTEGKDGVQFDVDGAVSTPREMQLGNNINALGAEDISNTVLSDHISKLPLMAILKRTPDSSSRKLSFATSTKPMSSPGEPISTPGMSSTTTPPSGKENEYLQLPSDCSLCCRPHRPNVAIKGCQCGRGECMKWAHAMCIINRKSGSVSTCVSHPGTPAPPLPMVLCEGIWPPLENALPPHHSSVR